MRRFFAILLLAVFGLPFVSPLLALGQDAEAGLPACCRRSGAHGCAMPMAERQAAMQHAPQWNAPPACPCPFCPASAATAHPHTLQMPVAQAIFAEALCHPAGQVQTECRWRIARDRARQKRGPPATVLA